MPFDRRTFIKTAAVAATSSMVSTARLSAGSVSTLPASIPFRLGVASYSLRELTPEQVISSLRTLETPWLCLKSFHLPYELSRSEIASARARYEAAGLTIVGGGNIPLRKDDDDAIRFYFEYAQAAGMPVIICSPLIAALPRVETFARAFGIKVAIHNHGPEDKEYPTATAALEIIKDMAPLMGVCLDIGHATRAGADIIAQAAAAGPRLFDVHIKDLKIPTDVNSQCVLGEGVLPIAAFLRQLQRQGYAGCVNLEYEIDAPNPLPGMQRCFAYLRGVVDGLTTA